MLNYTPHQTKIIQQHDFCLMLLPVSQIVASEVVNYHRFLKGC